MVPLYTPLFFGWTISLSSISLLGDKVDSGIGLSYRPASLCSLAGRYDNLMPEESWSSRCSVSKRLSKLVSSCIEASKNFDLDLFINKASKNVENIREKIMRLMTQSLLSVRIRMHNCTLIFFIYRMLTKLCIEVVPLKISGLDILRYFQKLYICFTYSVK